MEWNVVLPLIAVGLGWLLSELGNSFRRRREDRRLLRKALFPLIDLLFLIDQQRSLVENALKHYAPTPTYQHLAKTILVRSPAYTDDISSAKLEKALRDGVEMISGYDPFIAQDLKVCVDMTSIASFPFLRKDDEEITCSTLQTHLNSAQLLFNSVDQMLRRLAFRYDKRIWIRLHYQRLVVNRNRKSKTVKTWDDLFRSASLKSETPSQPSLRGEESIDE